MSLTQKLAELTEKRNKLNEELGKELMIVIKETLKEVFKNPKIKQISWCQFTQYFNDGDPCHFCMYEPRITIIDEEDEEDVYYWYEMKNTEEITEEEYKLIKDMWDACCAAEDLMQDLFGDGVEVICKQDEIEIAEYTDHD